MPDEISELVYKQQQTECCLMSKPITIFKKERDQIHTYEMS